MFVYRAYRNLLSEDAFYLRALLKPRRKVWYHNKPLGRETLGNVVKKITTKTAFEGHFSNHSPRRSSATRLYQSVVPEQVIVETTGHRPFDAVRDLNVHRQHLSKKHAKSCGERVLSKLKRMSREKGRSCLRIMLNSMKKQKWD